MKAKHAILFIAFGFCLDFVGTLIRSSSGFLPILAALLKVFGVLLLAYKVISYEGFRKFMNR